MQRFEIPTRLVKEVAKAIGYRKQTINIEVSDTVWLHQLNWDGGSKNEYTWFCLADGAHLTPDLGRPAPWVNKTENTKVEIAPGYIVVRTGWFMGKPSTATIHVRPENMPAYLTINIR